MTESQYLSWIRSALRSKSLKWPPRAKALELARRPYVGPVKQQKWEYQCAICGEWFKMKEVIVDHYPIAAGSILSIEDIGPFANNLYCEVDNLRVLDKVCHDVHTLSESHNVSFEEAKLLKEVIQIMKEESTEDILYFCCSFNYNLESLSNKEKREKAVYEILKEA